MNKSDWNYVDRWAKKIRAIRLLGGKCIKCGNDNILMLDFHHGDKNKESTYNEIGTYRWSVIEKEISKCVLFCKNCHQKYHYPETHDFKRKLMSMKEQYKCKKCGYDECLTSLDFHHRGEEDKKFNFGYVARRNGLLVSLPELVEELNKCDLLCKNCHAIEQIDVDKFNRLKDEIYAKDVKELPCAIDQKSVIDLYSQNIRSCDIAKMLNCARSTISKVLKDNGLKTNRIIKDFKIVCLWCKKEFGVRGRYSGTRRKFCSIECKRMGNRKVQRPSKEQLEADIGNLGWMAIGRKYNVTDNAVRHWARQYGLL
jgi:hypothetical protein